MAIFAASDTARQCSGLVFPGVLYLARLSGHRTLTDTAAPSAAPLLKGSSELSWLRPPGYVDRLKRSLTKCPPGSTTISDFDCRVPHETTRGRHGFTR